jgi:hypothetical protein
MLKFQTSIACISALIAGVSLSHSGTSQAQTVSTISVLAGEDPCPCGSHGGGFEAIYNKRKISVNFSYNPNPANPVKHPIIVLRNNKPINEWDSLLCSYGGEKCPIAGSKITVSGNWETKTTFDAYKISIK